jgi:hypothetical protein
MHLELFLSGLDFHVGVLALKSGDRLLPPIGEPRFGDLMTRELESSSSRYYAGEEENKP